MEYVLWIIFGLERNESLVVRTVGRADARRPFVTEKVDVGTLARKTFYRLIRLPRPLHVPFLTIIFPAREIKDFIVLLTERERRIALADA